MCNMEEEIIAATETTGGIGEETDASDVEILKDGE